MKITLTLMLGAFVALAVAALPSRRSAPAATLTPSDALADAMSSHGIGAGRPDGDTAVAARVAYIQASR